MNAEEFRQSRLARDEYCDAAVHLASLISLLERRDMLLLDGAIERDALAMFRRAQANYLPADVLESQDA